MKSKYYQMAINEDKKEADVYIYGDITSWEWDESDISSFTLSKELQSLPEDIQVINVYINSYGGEVAEGLAIRSALKRHKAKVRTYCDGFAASIASVIFSAGDERIMSNASLLFIHNAWSFASGDAAAMNKAAEDLAKITQASIEAYKEVVNLSEEKLKELMDAETWLSPAECIEMGFATQIVSDSNSNPAQSAQKAIQQILLANQREAIENPEPPETTEPAKTTNVMFEILKNL